MSKKTKCTLLDERLAEKRNIEDRLVEIKEKLSPSRLSPQVMSKMGVEAADLRLKIRSLKDRGLDLLTVRQKAELKEFEAKEESIMTELTRRKVERDNLEREKKVIECDLANYSYLCTEEELLEVKRKRKSLQDEIDEIKQAIRHQEEVIAETREEEPNIEAIESERQDVLAGMATGEAGQPALDKLDKELETARKTLADCAALTSQAEITILGLNKRLAASQARLDTLQADFREALCHYLVNRANLMSEEYNRTVLDIEGLISRLKALGALLENVSGGAFAGRIAAAQEYRLFLPAFTVGGPGQAPLNDGLLTADSLDLSKALDEERERLDLLGIELV